jgi:hypothetical protein
MPAAGPAEAGVFMGTYALRAEFEEGFWVATQMRSAQKWDWREFQCSPVQYTYGLPFKNQGIN